MKRVLILAAVVLLISGNGFAVILGSAHDFKATGWAGGEICLPCHTPHGADITVTDSPLWNHELTAETYTLYSSATLTATLGQPSGISKLCLSCHDGTVALENYGSTTGSTTNYISNAFGDDLSTEHPIGFPYTDALASSDGGLVAPSTANSSGLGGTITEDMLFSDGLECASCHDVHNGTGVAKLLLKSNAASALCLTCHSK